MFEENPPGERKPSVLNATLLIAALVLGIVAAGFVSPRVFGAVETDLSRTAVLLSTLRDPALSPRVVVFGNSVGMLGIDTKRISRGLPDRPLALNFCSTGQSLAEGFLYYDELPESVVRIIQILNPKDLAGGRSIPEQKYNAFYMNGYRPSAFTRSALVEALGAPMDALFSRSGLAQRFESRWAARQMVDRNVRKLLRPDLALENALTDLYFPSIHPEPLGPKKLQRALDLAFATWPETDFQLHEAQAKLLKLMTAWASEHRLDLVFLLPPAHPWIRAKRGSAFYDQLRQTVAEQIKAHANEVIDAIELLDAAYFADDIHPSDAGAAILSDYVAANLAERRKGPEEES